MNVGDGQDHASAAVLRVADEDLRTRLELAPYVEWLADRVEVIVVDGSDAEVFSEHRAAFRAVWLAERALTSWLAIFQLGRHGGIRYRGGVLRRAATPRRELRRRTGTGTADGATEAGAGAGVVVPHSAILLSGITIRDRLVARDASDGFVTDFGHVLSVFFRDPDGLEAEVCVANPDAQPGVNNPPGTPSLRYHAGQPTGTGTEP